LSVYVNVHSVGVVLEKAISSSSCSRRPSIRWITGFWG